MKNARHDQGASSSFTLDRAYFRGQAREAMRIFVAPLAGSYRAITPRLIRHDLEDTHIDQ